MEAGSRAAGSCPCCSSVFSGTLELGEPFFVTARGGTAGPPPVLAPAPSPRASGLHGAQLAEGAVAAQLWVSGSAAAPGDPMLHSTILIEMVMTGFFSWRRAEACTLQTHSLVRPSGGRPAGHLDTHPQSPKLPQLWLLPEDTWLAAATPAWHHMLGPTAGCQVAARCHSASEPARGLRWATGSCSL